MGAFTTALLRKSPLFTSTKDAEDRLMASFDGLSASPRTKRSYAVPEVTFSREANVRLTAPGVTVDERSSPLLRVPAPNV